MPWPYSEGLRLDEAMHDLTLMATGLYGKSLLPQNGAPVRLVVPWKYGFKSLKSIVKIDFVADMPETFWTTAGPTEYGFWANVNPKFGHPRWSQATERRIGRNKRIETLLFNGYAEEVASFIPESGFQDVVFLMDVQTDSLKGKRGKWMQKHGLRLVVHVSAILLAARLVWLVLSGAFFIDPVRQTTTITGKLAITFLLLSLSCTPVNIFLGWSQVMQVRRPLGLYAFGFALIHGLIYVVWDYQSTYPYLSTVYSIKDMCWLVQLRFFF